MGRLGYEGAYFRYSEIVGVLGDVGLKKLFTSLTMRAKQRKGLDKVMKMYKIVRAPMPATPANATAAPLFVYLPRHVALGLVDRGLNVTLAHPPPRTDKLPIVESAVMLYPNQRLVIDHLVNSIYTPENVLKGAAAATIDLGAGQGKTFIAGGLIKALEDDAPPRTLYIVPRAPLAEQAMEDLRGIFPGGNIKQLKASQSTIADIVIAVINSAVKMPISWFENFDLIVLDEVHMYCTDGFGEIFWKTQSRYTLGMSATTAHRADGFDPLYYNCVGHPIKCAELDGFDAQEEVFDSTVRVVKYRGGKEYTKTLIHPSTGMPFTPWMIPNIASDPARQKLAVEIALELYNWRDGEKRHNIYVFAEQKEILDDFKAAFMARVDASMLIEDEITSFYGGITRDEWSHAVNNGTMLCSTYQYSGTGVSIPKMTAILFLTPRKSGVVQIAARILRRGGDSDMKRVIYDIVDEHTILKHQFTRRLEAYDVYKMQIEEVSPYRWLNN